MKNLISKKRTMGHLSILILALLLLQGTVECVEEEDEYLEKCCELGSSWAGQKLRCERFTGPVSGVPRDEQPACLETVDICCRKTFEEQGCELGKTDAKSGRACDSGDADFKGTPVGNYRRDCCEGCKLGILTGSSGKSCAIKKLSLGEPWDSTFKECCNEAKTGTSTTKASTTPIKTTLSSTISTTNLLSEFDDVDDDIDDFTDPNFSDDSNLDLCKLMKGLLCSEICVSTPGSYYCKCNKGSTLQADGRTCKSNITTTTSTTTTTTVAPTTTTKKSTTRSTSSTNVTKANVVTTPKFTTSKIPPKKTTTVKMLKTTAKPKTTTVKPTKKKIFTTTKLTTVKSITTNSTTSKPFKKTTKPLLPASTLRMLSTAAKSRTTRSVSTEDNELQNCPSGYRFNPITETCDDIDECADGSHNCGNQKCYNSPGSFQCAKAQVPVIRKKTSTTVSSNRSPGNCAVGSRYDTVRGGCVDINECEELEDACSSNEECVNNPGSFVCNCRLGFRRDELTQACVDVNECQLENDCLPSQRCDNTIGSYTCVRFLPCGTGYTLNAATEICEDDDECVMGTHDCGGGYHCRNTLGSYRCDKDRGKATTTQRTTTRRTTRPTLRTVFTTSTTPRTTTTTTTTPRPTTTRRPTTTTTTTTRRPTTTVTTTTRRPTTTTTTVRTRATTPRTTTRVITTTEAIPTVGTLTTITPRARSNVVNQRTNCPRGFEPGPVGQCIDIDECHRNLKMCGNQRCINTIGSFRCEPQLICGIGYAPDPVTGQCKDIDECARGIHKCGPKQTCENTQGGYMCYCPLGYEIGINHDCLDVDECTRVLPGSACGNNGRCINTPGSFKCICDSGFVNDPMGGCNDMDECKMNPGSCQHNCYNTWGGYKCGCKFGYRLNADNRTCDDVDECSEFKDNNLCIGICENTPGSYACKCPTGYRLTEDKRTCQDIDECAAGNTCVPGEICQNVRGGYRCNKIHCPPGYVRDRQRKNRCIRESPYCPIHDQACFQRPAHYTFNYIAIVSMYPIPAATGQVELFTMRGAYNLPGSTVRFSIAFIQTRAPPHVQPATEECFALRKPFPSQAVLVMVKSLQGPQDIELEFSMEIYEPSGALAGSAVAKVFIVVTQYEF